MNKLAKYIEEKTKSVIWRYYAYSLLSNLWFIGAILVPFFTLWGHVSLFQVLVLQSWYSFWYFIFEVPTGIIADKIGRKYTLTFGAAICAIGLLTYSVYPNFILFMLGEFILALGSSLASGADEAILYEILKEQGQEHESKKYLGRGKSFELTGTLLGGLVGGIIATWFGLNAPFYLSAIPVLIAGGIAWTLHEPKIHSDRLQKGKVSLFITLRQGYTFLLQHKTLRLMALDSIVVSTAGYFALWLYQPLLQHLGIAIALFGLFQVLFTGTQIAASHNFTFLETLFGSARGYLRFSALATGLSFLLVALFPNLITVILFILLAGGLGMSRSTLVSSYMQQYIPSEKRATVLSSVSTFSRLAIALCNPLVGLAATHSLQLAILLLGLFPLVLFFFSPIEQEMFEYKNSE